MSALSSVANQVMWNRLISVVEEQARALVRTAFSTSVREAGDLSAGVYDMAGRMLAQAVTGTPGHVNAMAESVAHFMREIGVEAMREGDVYITNDPWMGTGHLHDITVVTPSFYKGRHVGYFACTAHVVDIGGRGFGADGNSVYEEGLLIPIMHFARKGEVNGDLVKIVRNNVREADQVVGDIYALAACNETGHRRLVDMLDEFGLDDLETIAGFILEHSHRATVEPAQGDIGRNRAQRDDNRRLCHADPAGGAAGHSRGPYPGRFQRHLGGGPQGHQRAAGLYQGLCLLRPQMRHRT
jgi:N-methylhydantoinase B